MPNSTLIPGRRPAADSPRAHRQRAGRLGRVEVARPRCRVRGSGSPWLVIRRAPVPARANRAAGGTNPLRAGHQHLLMAAAWLEGTGTALYVIFVLALVHLAGARAAWPAGSPRWHRRSCSP